MKSGQKSLDYEWYYFQMVGTIAIAIPIAEPFESLIIQNPIFKKSGFFLFPDFVGSDIRSLLYYVNQQPV